MTRTRGAGGAAVAAAKAAVLPLALAQFVASYAGSNMNVAISSIASDLGTSVTGIQTTITLFTLTMAALMIPGSKLTDIWGRKFCFQLGLIIYGAGALLASFAQGLPLLMIGYSLLEGVGSALLIPPIYILITMLFDDTTTRAKYFGVVSGAAGIGAAAGPLIGGLVTSYISWRASFILQVLIVAAIIWLGRGIADPPLPAQRPAFDWLGAVLSALGLFFVVFGVLQSGVYGWGTATQDYAIGDTVIIHQGGDLARMALRGYRRGHPGPVHRLRVGEGEERPSPAGVGQAVHQPHLQPGPADPEPANGWSCRAPSS